MSCDKEVTPIAGLAQYKDVIGGNLSIHPADDGSYNVFDGAIVVANCKALLDAITVFRLHADDKLDKLFKAYKEGR